MLKGKKIIFVIVEMIIICLALGCVSSFATDVKTITPKNVNTSNSTNTNTNSNTTKDDENNANKNTNNSNTNSNNTNTNTNSNKVNSISNNSSNYSNTNKNASNSSKLPYAGKEGTASIVFVGIALAASAAYAYKKVSEYKNI